MAKDKKGFVLYADLIHTMKYLTDEQRGLIFLWVLEYVNDMNPEPLSGLLQAVVEPIKQQLKRDLEKYEVKKESFSNSGKLGNLKRWNNDLYLKVISKSISIEEAEKIASGRKVSPPDKKVSPPIAKIAVKDTVTVKVKDKVKVTVKDIKYYREFKHLKMSVDEYNKLLEKGYTKIQIDNILDSIENYAKNKNYTSLYLTAGKWLVKEHGENNKGVDKVTDTLYDHVMKQVNADKDRKNGTSKG